MKPNLHHLEVGLPPTILTIFGATGDLSADYLLPALLHMVTVGLVPKDFHLVAVGRRDFTTKQYLDFIVKKSGALKKLTPAQKSKLLKVLTYYKGDLENAESFAPLAQMIADKEKPKHVCYNRLYYFATSPELFTKIARVLKESGLLTSCESHERKVRVLVEKPFGVSLASAKELNKLLLSYFSEEQIYRIDHYQGKETVQNLMVVRFANSIFEPLWNNRHIDHIEISVLEKDMATRRVEFYDKTGALKDFVQNHILQMLALLTMDEPYELTAEHIRNEKVKILKALEPFNAKSSASNLVRGQYEAYAKEAGGKSETETFVALKASINTPRWKGVPVYIRTGKALSKKVAEVSVHFKEPVRCIFTHCAPNVLTFRIQPDESVHLQLNNKVPGFGIDLTQGDYEFGYNKAFAKELPAAYERLLLDFMQGDQRLFIRSDEIEAAWKFVDSITDSWKNTPVVKYKAGSNGPKEAEELMKKDIKEWFTQ
jgi:glucose-6-phosphate 1-dehydrogenase